MLQSTDLADELRKRPFEPFRIHVSDGSTYEVRHPDFVMVSPSRVLIFVPLPDQAPPLFARYDTVALMHITRLEPIPMAASPSSN